MRGKLFMLMTFYCIVLYCIYLLKTVHLFITEMKGIYIDRLMKEEQIGAYNSNMIFSWGKEYRFNLPSARLKIESTDFLGASRKSVDLDHFSLCRTTYVRLYMLILEWQSIYEEYEYVINILIQGITDKSVGLYDTGRLTGYKSLMKKMNTPVSIPKVLFNRQSSEETEPTAFLMKFCDHYCGQNRQGESCWPNLRMHQHPL